LFETSLGKSIVTEDESVVDKEGSRKVAGEGWRNGRGTQDPFVCRVTRWWSFVTQQRR
ncbi:hypothetical protein A2U01_0101277, partial [Trifolium medium]|nr:hypothetical protein [Trifolium medium]